MTVYKNILAFFVFFFLSSLQAATVHSEISKDVQELFKQGTALKSISTFKEAEGKIKSLRQSLGTDNVEDRYATKQERDAIIQTIVHTEILGMLRDGCYDNPFLNLGYDLTQKKCNTNRLCIHYGMIFGIARTTQLLLQNPIRENEDLRFLIEINVHQFVPDIWKVWESNLKNVDWKGIVNPHLKGWESFGLTKARLDERKEDQKKRLKFDLDFPEKVSSEFKHNFEKSCISKGTKFSSKAFLEPGKYSFDAFAINPDGACEFYGCQGPFGYFNREDFGEQIIANIDHDQKLEEMVRNSIVEDIYTWVKKSPRETKNIFPDFEKTYGDKYHSFGKYKYKKSKVFETEEEKFKDFEAMEEKNKEEAKKNLKNDLTKEKLKEVVKAETLKFFKTGFNNFTFSYVDIMVYLNGINLFQTYKTKNDSELSLLWTNAAIQFDRGQNAFLLSASEHVTRLIQRTENPLENLFEYIKAKAHEDRHGTKITAGYQSSWM